MNFWLRYALMKTNEAEAENVSSVPSKSDSGYGHNSDELVHSSAAFAYYNFSLKLARYILILLGFAKRIVIASFKKAGSLLFNPDHVGKNNSKPVHQVPRISCPICQPLLWLPNDSFDSLDATSLKLLEEKHYAAINSRSPTAPAWLSTLAGDNRQI